MLTHTGYQKTEPMQKQQSYLYGIRVNLNGCHYLLLKQCIL